MTVLRRSLIYAGIFMLLSFSVNLFLGYQIGEIILPPPPLSTDVVPQYPDPPITTSDPPITAQIPVASAPGPTDIVPQSPINTPRPTSAPSPSASIPRGIPASIPAKIASAPRNDPHKVSLEDREQENLTAQRMAIQRRYRKALEALPLGESFHNVPSAMKANIPVLVKAGIAPSVTKQLLDQLDVQGPVSIRENIRYDPLGVEIKLNVDDKMFRVRPITEGKKPVIPGDPAIWIWELTPLKRGKTVVTIQALVELKVPRIDEAYKKDTIVFSEEREVEVNLGYTVSQLMSNYWQAISGLVFGSGSIAAFSKWFIEQRSKQGENPASKGVAGFGRFLPTKQQGKSGN